jgi:hypothetical protein
VVAFSGGKPVTTFPENALKNCGAADRSAGRAINDLIADLSLLYV